MPTSRHVQTALTAGEFDPLLWSREDVSFFYNSARLIENVIPLPQGGGNRREGWGFRAVQRGPISEVDISGATPNAPNGGTAANLIDGNANTLLATGESATITNITNADPAVVTAAGHGFTTGDAVAISGVEGMNVASGDTAAITGATQAAPCVITATSHGFADGSEVEITGVSGMTELNNRAFTISIIDGDSFALVGEDSTGHTAYSTGGEAEIFGAGGINTFSGSITVLSANTFELDDFDTSSASAYSSGGEATKGIGEVAEYEVFELDLGAQADVSFFDISQARIVNLPASVSSATATLQFSDNGSAWSDAASISVGNTAYDRRIGSAPDTLLASARYWRLIIENAGDLGGATVEMSEAKIWSEAGYSAGGTPGNFSAHRLTATIEAEFVLLMTAGNADVFDSASGAWVAAIAIPHEDGEVRAIKSTSNLDSLILYHNDQPPYILQRLAGDQDWQSRAIEFDSITEFPFETGLVGGGKNEIQLLQFASMGVNNRVVVEFNGEISDEILWTTNIATNAANLQAAINGLSDITSVVVAHYNGGWNFSGYTVEFTGQDGNQPWAVLVVDLLTGSGTATISRTQRGRKDFDALWSATRGYPSCGTFYQGRHWMGGFKARPDVIAASRAGALFDFKEDADPIAASPIVAAPNVDEQITIQNLFAGRHLQIFTSSAEFYVPAEPITVDNIALKVTSRLGASADVKPVDVQGGTLFIDRNGQSLREYLFTDAEQSYSAEPVSLLAGHLVSSPQSLVFRRSRRIEEPSLLLMANTGLDRNGDPVPAALVAIDRAQQVTGFCRVKTQGTPLDFVASQNGDAFAVVRRSLAGAAWNYLEQFDGDLISDCSVIVSGSGSTVDVSDYPFFEGQTVYVHGDGLPLGEYVVASGEIDLGDLSYSESAEVGLKMLPRIILHPFKGKGEMSPTMQNQRIFRILLQLERTGAVAVTANDGGRPREVGLLRYDQGVMDPTLEEVLFSGPIRVSGVGRWQKEPTVEITQLLPMPFLLRSITYDVRY